MLGSFFSGLFGLVSNGVASANQVTMQDKINRDNIAFQKETNAQNQANFEKTFDYNANQNLITRQREDTAHQREVNDLKAAGLSPLASTNGLGSGQVISAPVASQLVAPQADATGYLQSASTLSHLGDLFTSLYSIDSENARAEAKNDLDKMLTFAQMSNELAKTEQLISSNERIAEGQNANSFNIAIQKMKNDLDLLELQNSYENSRQASRLSHEVEQKLRDKGIYDFDRYKDFKKYEDAMKVYNSEYDNFFTEWNENLKKYATSESSSFGADVDFGKGDTNSNSVSTIATSAAGKVLGKVGDSLLKATNFKAGAGFNKSSSEFESKDFSALFLAAEKKWHMEHPRPLYVGS